MTLQPESPRLSFIMPARNEERYVGQSIESIRTFCPEDLLCDIILVDHGSTDRTREIAKAAGAVVLQPQVATIAALRNEGATVAKGNIFVFLDADVTLTEAWRSGAREMLEGMLQDPNSISGSNCAAPDSDNWFLRYWFKELALDQSAVALGSAHMIVPRTLFERLRGFDERLRTGEDPDLCGRAKVLGAEVTPRPSLKVIHHGYPLTVGAFVRRERWHGGGDTVSLKRALSSKVVWMTLVFLGLHLAILLSVFVSPWWTAGLFGLLWLHLFVSARVRFKRLRGTSIVKAMAIFYLYYLGRSLSFVRVHERGAR